LEPERERLAEIIARGLRRTWTAGSTLCLSRKLK